MPNVDSLSYRSRPCVRPLRESPPKFKNKSVLVACSLEQYARHTQTVNLYAPLTLRFGQAHGGWTVSPGPVHSGRLAGPRYRTCLPYVRLGRSRSGPASTCIEDPRVRSSSVATRSARPPRSYRVRHRRLELWTSSQERRGLCQAPDTRMWLNARKRRRRETLPQFSPASGKHSAAPMKRYRLSAFQGCCRGPSGGAGKVLVPPRPRI